MQLPGKKPERIGPYQIVRTIGAGGMGMVYEARHPQVPRPVALKVILSNRASPKAMSRFWREAEAMAKVRHPGVVAIHQMGQSAEGPYIVQEMIHGRSLKEVAEERPGPQRVAELVRDMAEALAAVHAQGILHRDLKPGNVIIRADGSPVLLDFGLARDVDAETLTRTGEILGTPAFMAPEQARAAAMDARTDVYGLGTLLYCLLAGRPPFIGPAIQAMALVISSDPDWPSAERPETSPELEAILRKAMAKSPDDRYESATALRDDLDRYLRGEGSRAEEEERSRRIKRLALPASASILLSVGVAIWAIFSTPVPTAPTNDTPPEAAPAPEAPAELAPPTADGALWQLGPQDALRYRFDYRETDGILLVDIGGVVYSERIEPGAEEIRIVYVAESLDGNLTAAGGRGTGKSYSTREHDPEHPFAILNKVVGQAFQLWVDPATGAATRVEGFREIVRVVVPPGFELRPASGHWSTELGLNPAVAVQSFLRDSFIRGTLDTVSRVRRKGWKARRDGYRLLERRESLVLPRLVNVGQAPRDYALEVEATSRFSRGSLELGEMTQKIVEPPSARFEASWRWERLD